jgi:hypothetical protein
MSQNPAVIGQVLSQRGLTVDCHGVSSPVGYSHHGGRHPTLYQQHPLGEQVKVRQFQWVRSKALLDNGLITDSTGERTRNSEISDPSRVFSSLC